MADNQNSLLTNSLTSQEKKNFYNSMKDNNFELFVSYLFGDEANEPYDIFEDLSESGNNWTIFHYAMDYGKLRIIKFIIGYLIDSNLIDIAMKMKTKDDKCPMLCLLKSNKLKLDEKKDIYFQIINSFHLTLNKDVINEANKIFYNNNIKAAILTNELTSEEKMDFYNSVIEGNLELFKNYINGTSERKPYNIFEEVSASGYNWTVFHYAMFYGKWEIIKYIFEYLSETKEIEIALNILSKDGRCPLLCLLKSNSLNKKEKREIFSKIIKNFHFTLRNEVKIELFNRNMEDLNN